MTSFACIFLLYLRPVVVDLLLLPLGKDGGVEVSTAATTILAPLGPEGQQVLGVKVDVHLLLLLEKVVEHVRVVPDLAADGEGFQGIWHTSSQRKPCSI